jgi:hypothetical protein
VIREVHEELGVGVIGIPEEYYVSPVESAAGDEQKTVQIVSFFVLLDGEPKASSEIEELHWLTKQEFEQEKFLLGSILHDHVIPKLIAEGMMGQYITE